jgi:hypothetical protein
MVETGSSGSCRFLRIRTLETRCVIFVLSHRIPKVFPVLVIGSSGRRKEGNGARRRKAVARIKRADGGDRVGVLKQAVVRRRL